VVVAVRFQGKVTRVRVATWRANVIGHQVILEGLDHGGHPVVSIYAESTDAAALEATVAAALARMTSV
jgi:hypothetical protein